MNRKDIRLVDRRVKELNRQIEAHNSNDDYHDMIASRVRNIRLMVPRRTIGQWFKVGINWISLILSYILCPIWAPIVYIIAMSYNLYDDRHKEGLQDLLVRGTRYWWKD